MVKKGTIKDWLEIFRLYSLPASLIPVSLGAVLAAKENIFNWNLFFLLVIAVSLLHGAANIVNEYYDVKNGIDTKGMDRHSSVLIDNRISPNLALKISKLIIFIFLLGTLVFSFFSGLWYLIFFSLIGSGAGFYYTAPPWQVKYRGLGFLTVFLIFGLILPQGIYYTFSGKLSLLGLYFSLPIAFLISAILLANDLRDFEADKKIVTITRIIGLNKTNYLFIFLIIAPFVLSILSFNFMLVSYQGLLVFITLPLALKIIRLSYLGINKNNKRLLLNLDKKCAVLLLLFGGLNIFSYLF